jgi:hypothetical protein
MGRDNSRRLSIVSKERVSMLPSVRLYLTKGTINVRVNSFRCRSERHFSGGGRKLGIALN